MNTIMNTVNQTFSWRRFTAALRKELVENKRTILFTLLGVYLVLTLIMILGNVRNSMTDDLGEALLDLEPQRTVWLLLLVFVPIVASLAFHNLKGKNGRIRLFTSPSSTLEKYTVNVLIYVIGAVIAYFALAFLADLTRVAVLSLYKGHGLLVPGPINLLKVGVSSTSEPSTLNPIVGIFGAIGIILAMPGMYLLGSILWPRLSLLKTFAVGQIITIVLGAIIFSIIYFALGLDEFATWAEKHDNTLESIFYIFMGVQAVLYWGLSWFLFKRKDVVSLKWWK